MLFPTNRTQLRRFQKFGIIARRINWLLSYKLRAQSRDPAGSTPTS
jgi:hypothetical protein